MIRRPPRSTLFPYTTLFRSGVDSLSPARWQSVHGGFNTSRINEDPHRVLPLDVARELEREGVIGRLHPEFYSRSEEHTSELQSQSNLVCRLLLEKKKKDA